MEFNGFIEIVEAYSSLIHPVEPVDKDLPNISCVVDVFTFSLTLLCWRWHSKKRHRFWHCIPPILCLPKYLMGFVRPVLGMAARIAE